MPEMSMGLHRPPAVFNPNVSIASGTGLPPIASLVAAEPMHLGGFPGWGAGGHTNMFGYGAPYHPTMVNPAANDAPGAAHFPNSNNEESIQPPKQFISGMMPMMFGGGMPANDPMVAAQAPLAHPALMQVVSSDSRIDDKPLTDIAGEPVTMVSTGNAVALQKPKKWGEGAFGKISEKIFLGSRSESQCKSRWKKVSWPVKSLSISFVGFTH